jgi:hypothetical protein
MCAGGPGAIHPSDRVRAVTARPAVPTGSAGDGRRLHSPRRGQASARVEEQRFRNQDASEHRRRGQSMIAIDKSNPANAGMMARPAIQTRPISPALA